MKKKQQEHFYTHQYPAWLLQHPQWIRLLYGLNYLLQLRKWYIVNRLYKLLNTKKEPFTLLDAGCAEGQYLFPFAAHRTTSHFKGIDREKSNIHFCRRYADSCDMTHVHFETTTLEALNEREVYDIILCISVLPYCKNDHQALTSLNRAMKANGELLLYVPVNNKKTLPFYQKMLKKYENYESVQQNQRAYTENGLTALLADCNFSIVEATKTYGFFGKLSNEIFNIHLMLFNAYPLPVKIIITLSLFIFFPLILLCMLLDFVLPVSFANGWMLTVKKTN